MIQFSFTAELRQIAAENDKIGFGRQQIGFRNGPDQTPIPVSDEMGSLDMLDVGIGNIGKGKVLVAFCEGQFD